MKKSIKEAVYTLKPEEIEIEKVETLQEHQTVLAEPVIDFKINIQVKESKLTEDCKYLKIIVEKKDFKSLFGADAKPRKGDVLSIAGLTKKFKVKNRKKFTARKKGKAYQLTLKSE